MRFYFVFPNLSDENTHFPTNKKKSLLKISLVNFKLSLNFFKKIDELKYCEWFFSVVFYHFDKIIFFSLKLII